MSDDDAPYDGRRYVIVGVGLAAGAGFLLMGLTGDIGVLPAVGLLAGGAGMALSLEGVRQKVRYERGESA